MSEQEPDVTVEEILQDDAPFMGIKAVPVVVEGPVATQRIPSPKGKMRSFTLIATEATHIVGENLQRTRIVLYSDTEPIYVGNSKQEAELGTGGAALWPELETLEMFHASEIWARCATAGLTTTLTVIAEYWAD